MTKWSDGHERPSWEDLNLQPWRMKLNAAVSAIRDRREQDERVLNQVLSEMAAKERELKKARAASA